MGEKSKRVRTKWVALLSASALALVWGLWPSQPALADRLPAAQVENGYLIIGTFLIHKDALSDQNVLAAEASMEPSGQGMYYKSEFADGAWCGIDEAGEIAAITSEACEVVPDAEIDELAIKIQIDAGNGIASLLSKDELQKQIGVLKKDVEKLEEQHEELLEDGKNQEASDIALKKDQLNVQIRLLTALRDGNQAAATKELAKLDNPDAAQQAMPSSLAEAMANAQESLEQSKQELEAALQEAKDGDATDEEIAKLEEKLKNVQRDIGEMEKKRTASLPQLLKDAKTLAEAIVQAAAQGDEGEIEQKLADLVLTDALLAELQKDENAAKQRLAEQTALLQKAYQQAADDKLAVADQLLDKMVANGAQASEIVKASTAGQVAALQEKLAQTKAEKQQALASGQMDKADQLAAAEAVALGELAALESGAAAEAKDLQDAATQLAAQIEQPGKGVDVQSLRGILEQVKQDLIQAEKQVLLQKLDAADKQQMEQVRTLGVPSAALEALKKQAMGELRQKEKEKYSPQELANLAAIQAAIEQKGIPGVTGKVTVLPVESVVSKEAAMKLEMPPVLVDGRVLIHIRPISEEFGSLVIWSDEERSVTVSRDEKLVFCRIDDPLAYVGGNPYGLDVPPKLVEGRTIVPLRFVIEGIGLNVEWDAATQTVLVEGLVR